MKKLLGAALSLALLFPSGPASAELLKNLKVNGSLDVRGVSANNLIDVASGLADHIGDVQSRTMLNAGWDVLDDVHATVTLRKNDRTWGTHGQSPVTPSNFQGNQALVGDPNSHSDIASNVAVQQANVKIDKVFGMFDVTAGRQYYGEPSDFAIHYGVKGSYGMYVTAIDAFRVDNENQWVKWSGLVGQTVGATTTCANPPDTSVAPSSLATTCPTQWVTGVDTWIKNLPVKVGPFLWWRQTKMGNMNDNLYLYGFRLRAEGMGAWFNLDAGANAGENRGGTTTSTGAGFGTVNATAANYDGYAFMAKAGYKADVPNVAAFAPWGTFVVGSGRTDKTNSQNKDFTSITNSPTFGFINSFHSTTALGGYGNGLYTAAGTTGYDSAGALSKTGTSNKIDYGFGLNATPAALSKLTVGAAFWNYWFQHATSATAAAAPIAKGNRHIGSELDASATWKHSDNVSFQLQVGHFMPGGHVNELFNTVHALGVAALQGVGPSPINAAQFDTNIKF